MISYGKQSLDSRDIKSVVKVLKSGFITQGPKTEEFENVLKNKFGSKHACVVSSGTAALHLTAIALGWNSGDVILTSPITFLSSVNSIIYSGAIPDFVDINSEDYTIDIKKLEEKIKKYRNIGDKIKAVIAVDYAGHPCDWKSLRRLASKYNFRLINDNCHAIGAKYFNNSKFATKYADVAIHSYHAVKNFTTAEGGSVLTNDKSLDEKVRVLRSHGMIRNTKFAKNKGSWHYEMHNLGYNYRLTDLQCALGISQLKKLEKFLSIRRAIAKKYDLEFKKDSRFILPKVSKNVRHAYHLYPLLIKFNELKISKKNFFKKMEKIGIKLQVHYIPVHLQPFYKKNFNFKLGDFPIAEKFYLNQVSIPIYPRLKKKEINFVVKEIKKNLK